MPDEEDPGAVRGDAHQLVFVELLFVDHRPPTRPVAPRTRSWFTPIPLPKEGDRQGTRRSWRRRRRRSTGRRPLFFALPTLAPGQGVEARRGRVADRMHTPHAAGRPRSSANRRGRSALSAATRAAASWSASCAPSPRNEPGPRSLTAPTGSGWWSFLPRLHATGRRAGGMRVLRAARSLQPSFGGFAAAQLAAPLYFRVHFRTEEEGKPRQPEPGQHHDHGRE